MAAPPAPLPCSPLHSSKHPAASPSPRDFAAARRLDSSSGYSRPPSNEKSCPPTPFDQRLFSPGREARPLLPCPAVLQEGESTRSIGGSRADRQKARPYRVSIDPAADP